MKLTRLLFGLMYYKFGTYFVPWFLSGYLFLYLQDSLFDSKPVPFFGHRTPPQALSSPTQLKGEPNKSPRLLSRQSSSSEAQSSQRLTFRLPKAGAYTGQATSASVYDFDEDEESVSDNRRSKSDSTSDIDVVSPSPDRKSVGAEIRRGRNRGMSGSSDVPSDSFSTPETQLKLKIPAGRVIRCSSIDFLLSLYAFLLCF